MSQVRTHRHLYDLRILLAFGTLILCEVVAFAQKAQQDTTENLIQRIQGTKVVKELTDAITHKSPSGDHLDEKSEEPFLSYEGKIIRNVSIKQIGFGRKLPDTTTTVENTFVHIANQLHVDSKEATIRRNLFIKPGEPLDPFRTADNERYLRDLNFIMDARIKVEPVDGSPDSVDVTVSTRDVFSFGGTFHPHSGNSYEFSTREINLLGGGQQVRFTGLYDYGRRPRFGYEGYYQRLNVLGSFINASVLYTKINSGLSAGTENENAIALQLQRPLFSPFTRWTGGTELSYNQSTNVFSRPDSLFTPYRYSYQNYWIGFTFAPPFIINSKSTEVRRRGFFALRGYNLDYRNSTFKSLEGFERRFYRDKAGVLGQITLFQENFYKTQYVLGFGITEDIPYGFNISLTSGLEREAQVLRPYTGLGGNLSTIGRKGSITSFSLNMASYWNDGNAEDALLETSATRYTRLFEIGRFQMRHQFEAGYARQFNQRLKVPLDIRDMHGMQGFLPDTLYGSDRIHTAYQVVLFTPWRIVGFHLAPIGRIELVRLTQTNDQKQHLYTGFSAGIRGRNENLIFNTTELRFYFFPRTVGDLSSFRITLKANLRFRYPTDFISKPGTVYDTF